MTQQGTQQVARGQGVEVTYGSVSFVANDLLIETFPQAAPTVSSSSFDRATQAGVQKVKISDYSGGLTSRAGIGDVRTDLNVVAYGQGPVTRIKNLLYPPYAVTTQSSITSDFDISGFNAANKRVHALLSSLGDTGQRFLAGIGVSIFGDTSLTDPTLKIRAANGADYVTAAAPLRLNGTNYAAFAFKNVSEAVGVSGFTDVSGSGTLSGTQLIAPAASGDAFYAMQYFPDLHANIFIGQYNGVADSLWWVSDSASIPAVPQPLVYKNNKDVEGIIPVVTTSAATPVSAFQEVTDGNTTPSYDWGWGGLTNLGSVNAAYATFVNSNSPGFSYPLRLDFGGQFSSIPLNAIGKGYQLTYTGHEDAANQDTFFRSVQLTVNGSRVGDDRANPNNFELNATTDTTTTFGSTTDAMGVQLTGTDYLTIGTRVVFNSSSINHTGTNYIDTGTLAITYRVPGTQATAQGGGCRFEPMPNFPDRMCYAEPLVSESTTYKQPRRLLYLDLELDVAGNRPVVTTSYANTSLTNIHHGIPFGGGMAVVGGNTMGPGDRILIVQDTGKPVDLTAQQVPMFMRTTTLLCNKLENCNGMLAMEMVNADFSDVQIWLWDVITGKCFPDTQQQSTTATSIALQPLAWGETTLNLQQNRRYTIFPKTTHVGVRREFIPSNLYADPRVVNKTEPLSSTTLSVQGMEMAAGYEEAGASLLRADYQERRIDAAFVGAIGTSKLEVETDGDATISSPAFTHIFDTAYSSYNAASGGAAYQTIIPRISVRPAASGLNGPNGLPFLLTLEEQWNPVEQYTLSLIGWKAQNVFNLVDKLDAQAATKPTQALIIGNLGFGNAVNSTSNPGGFNAVYDKVHVHMHLPARGAGPSDDLIVEPVQLVFRRTMGQSTA